MINKYVKKFFRNINIVLLLFLILYCILLLLPTSIWFEYESIEPQQSSFTQDEQIWFISTLQVYRQSHIEYNDILLCNYFDERDGNVYVSNYTTKNITPVSEGVYTSSRERHGNLPKDSWLCYIRSIVCTRVLNINKCQVYDGLENDQTFNYIVK
jgi:hypothetical protein